MKKNCTTNRDKKVSKTNRPLNFISRPLQLEMTLFLMKNNGDNNENKIKYPRNVDETRVVKNQKNLVRSRGRLVNTFCRSICSGVRVCHFCFTVSLLHFSRRPFALVFVKMISTPLLSTERIRRIQWSRRLPVTVTGKEVELIETKLYGVI